MARIALNIPFMVISPIPLSQSEEEWALRSRNVNFVLDVWKEEFQEFLETTLNDLYGRMWAEFSDPQESNARYVDQAYEPHRVEIFDGNLF